jgi:hypothetical protein
MTYCSGMCMQCMASAMTAVGAASGTRAYLGSCRASWLTARRLRLITIGLMVAALFASATLVSGSSASPDRADGPAAQTSASAQR